jgi:hypothetical protein
MEKKNKKFLEDEFEKLRDLADVNPDSDIPVTEKLTKEKKRKDFLDN